jgi:hypothetical protein
MRPTGSVEGLLILACVDLAVFLGFAGAVDDNGDLGLSPRPAADPRQSADEAAGGASTTRDWRRAGPPALREGLSLPGPLAAVPGGLRLLI